MESPVVLEKPPEYHGTERGFPFEDEEGSGAWSELAARHPDIAARLRQRPATATWARKRRPSSQDPTEDFGENFSGFEGFPFDDIPPEFREHFPTHWNRRFGGQRDEAPPHQPQQPQPPQPQNSPPQQSTAATQTEQAPEPEQSELQQLPTYGLRNTVDLGQKSPADPSLVDAEERAARSMSAPPPDMSSPPPAAPPAPEHASNVRHIPIFVEGRDEPVINKGEHKPTYTQPPQSHPQPQPQPHPHPHSQPHIDRDHYFTDDVPPSFHHPPNFSRAFGTPFNKGFRQGPQPFTQQKAYPQTAFNRGASPGRAQSPAAQPPPPPPPAAEQFTRVPVQQEAPPAPAPPQAPKPGPNDPITQILAIQTDVLNLMTEVENFTGTKKDKRYIYLDEMLTRNLIKLDNIETDGKENIRLARKEAIRCIQKSIAVLEAKAEKGGGTDVAMKDNASNEAPPADNGEVEMKEDKSDLQTEAQNGDVAIPQADAQPTEPNNESETTPPSQEQTNPSNANPEEHKIDDKPSPKKKVVKKRDKSKDKAPAASEAAKDSNKVEENVEVMQLDNKGKDSSEQVMEVDGAASQ